MTFPEHVDARVRAVLDIVPAQDSRDVYVVSLFVYDFDDDPRQPTVTVGYNTEQAVAAVGARTAADQAEARWNYACWLQNELDIVGDPDRDPEGCELRSAWLDARALGYSDEEADRAFEAWQRQVDGAALSPEEIAAIEEHEGKQREITGGPSWTTRSRSRSSPGSTRI